MTLAELRTALEALQESFVLLLHDGGQCYWTYKHPTIADAYARMISRKQELVTLFVYGAKMPQILNEAICGGGSADGIVVPPSLYPLLFDRLPKSGVTDDMMRHFLLHRSGADFLRAFLERYPEFVTRPWREYDMIVHDPAVIVMLRAARHQCLPEEGRDRLVNALRSHVENRADLSFLVDKERHFEGFLSDDERRELLDLGRRNTNARFDRAIDAKRRIYSESWDPEAWFANLREMIGDHRTIFPDDDRVTAAVDRATKRLDDIVEGLEESYWKAVEEQRMSRAGSRRIFNATGRSIFDDLV